MINVFSLPDSDAHTYLLRQTLRHRVINSYTPSVCVFAFLLESHGAKARPCPATTYSRPVHKVGRPAFSSSGGRSSARRGRPPSRPPPAAPGHPWPPPAHPGDPQTRGRQSAAPAGPLLARLPLPRRLPSLRDAEGAPGSRPAVEVPGRIRENRKGPRKLGATRNVPGPTACKDHPHAAAGLTRLNSQGGH